ncbi:MAG: hypothetical protein LCH39_13695 [Proteobacteria bacterium]|nr:hypothetical protein [Pseudomonadota bacterium]
MTEKPRVVIFGCGDQTRVDQAVGPRLLRQMAGEYSAVVTCIEDEQLRHEHALLMENADLLLFIRSCSTAPSPFLFREALASPAMTPHPTPLDPESVLSTFQQIRDRQPPPAFEVVIGGEHLTLRSGLWGETSEQIAEVLSFIRSLLVVPRASFWRSRITPPQPATV